MVFTWQSWMVLKLINNRATSSTLLIFCRICLSPQNFKNCLNRYSHYVLEGILKLPSRAVVDDILTVSQPEIILDIPLVLSADAEPKTPSWRAKWRSNAWSTQRKQLYLNTIASTLGHQLVKTETVPVINCTNKIIKASGCFSIEKSALRTEILNLLRKNRGVLIFIC